MRNVVGQIASKGDFYIRNTEIKRLIRAIDAGANIQLTAPRRVGKSSILYYLKDNPIADYNFVYIEVESARNQNDYYRKMYKEILKSDALTNSKKFWEQLKNTKNNFLKRLKGLSIGDFGSIELNENANIDYEEELLNLLSGIELNNEKLIIMVDEFPEVILNIVEDENGEIKEAKKFLQSNRAFRNNAEIRSKVQFIYTGSNSLNIIAANLDSSVFINDLNSVPVLPLNTEESKDLVSKVLDNYGYKIDNDKLTYLISKVEWLIPFYLQLMIQEIINLIEPEEDITSETIDKAFQKIMDQRNDHHFEHYVKRLKRLFVGDELKFVHLFLNTLAKNQSITKNEVLNMSHGIVTESQNNKILTSLVHDGYIIFIEENRDYKFNSPILKRWWYNHEC
jgi:uncharacterized protein